MYIVHVSIKVKEEFTEAFVEATVNNAKSSVKELGIARFDFLQQQGAPSTFLLAEAYFTQEDQLKHRETGHFKKWRETITDMLVEPYTFIKYDNVYPDNSEWTGINIST